jgi:hypothetical protein
LRIYKNRVLRRVFGPEVEGGGQKDGRNCRMRSIIIFTLRQILLGVVKLRMGGTCSTPDEKRCLEKLGIDCG